MTDFTERASGPTQAHAYRSGPRITALETVIPHDVMPGLLALRIHTDAGTVGGTPVIGHGETYYIPTAAAAVIHDFMAPRLLGSDARAIESHWRFLYERMTAFGGTGAELRALSAVDLALWDIAGQLAEQPVWRLLGGPVRDAVPVYNSCGGPFYGRSNRKTPSASGWPGHGDPGQPGPLEDNWASMNSPADLAEELVALGYKGMKLWSFDAVYRRQGGHYLSWDDIREGVEPFEKIRERVGDRIEVMLDGHGFFSLAAARRIADGNAGCATAVDGRHSASGFCSRDGCVSGSDPCTDCRERNADHGRRLSPGSGIARCRLRDDRSDMGRRYLGNSPHCRTGSVVQRANVDARLHGTVYVAGWHQRGSGKYRRRFSGNRAGSHRNALSGPD